MFNFTKHGHRISVDDQHREGTQKEKANSIEEANPNAIVAHDQYSTTNSKICRYSLILGPAIRMHTAWMGE